LDEASVVGLQCEEAIASLNIEGSLEAPAAAPEYRHEEDILPPPPAEEEVEQAASIGGKPPTIEDPPGLIQPGEGVVAVDIDEEIDPDERELEVAMTFPPDTAIYEDDVTADPAIPDSARALEKITALEDPADECVETMRIREETPDIIAGNDTLEWHVMNESMN
jgi:hypothetical protein